MKLLKKEILTRTTAKPELVVFALISAVVISVGYVLFLAILAPEQLAEATAAATDLVCSGCVGTSDIADSAVTSSKIGSGQVTSGDIATNAVTSTKIPDGGVGNSDLATSAVTSTKIGSGQVANSDIASSAVTSSKISDTAGVQSVDIVNGQVGSVDIADGQVTTEDIASGAIFINRFLISGGGTNVEPGETISTSEDCPDGTWMTGGGFQSSDPQIRVFFSGPGEGDTWMVQGINEGETSASLAASVACIDQTAPD
jgi:hypothetical protein